MINLATYSWFLVLGSILVVGTATVLPAAAVPTASVAPPEAGTSLERNDTSNWYPFTFPLDDTNLDSLDLTGFLDPPAGKRGFLTVGDDGHFYFQDGTRARFFGTNVAGATAIPTKEQAPVLAARLAKYGVNMLRIHAIDGRWAGNFIDYKRGDTRHLSADLLDRLGFFVAELKQRGIYVYLDLLDYRLFQPADGVRDAAQLQSGWQNSVKGASTFNERMIELQQEYAEQFLTYHNPHTGLRFVDDPAVAVVEITNENSLFYTHNTSLMLPSYVEELRQRWNRWLVEKFGMREALAQAWTNARGECALQAGEDPAAGTVVLPMKHLYQDPAKAPFVGEQSPVRVNAMVRFFFELQRDYYGRMRAHLKAIGVKVPITGTNQTFCPASNYADAIHEFMSRNNYWLHPNVQAKPMFTFRNLPLVGSDLVATSNPIVEVASSAVAGKPMISPEFNFPWPNEHRAECLPLMAAYACLQDWDGLLFYNYRPDRQPLEMFGSQSDPVRWGQFPAAALLFHRQDVAVAKNTVSIAYREEEIFTARPSHGRARTSAYRHFTYLSKVRNVYGGHSSDAVSGVDFQAPTIPDNGYTSDTGELNLNSAQRLFTIRTARTKAAVGFLGQAGRIDLEGVVVHCRTPFAAVMVTSLDDRPIVGATHASPVSQRLLVTAVARAENTGQAFDSNKSRVPQIGQLPVIAEPVDGEIEIKMNGAVTLYPLDETGKRRQGVPATVEQGVCRIPLADLRSPWCEVEIKPVSDAKARDAGRRGDGPLAVRREGDKIVVTSSAAPTWQAVVDGRRGGVITDLRVPADGNNVASDDGSRFEGLCNLIYVDFKETGKDGAYVAKGSLYYFGTTEGLLVLEEGADHIVVEVTGRAGNQVQPQADVLRYRQRYTFRADRIICAGEADWLFDEVTPGSRPELIQFNNVFAPGAVEGEMSVWDADTGPVPLPQTKSKGRNYPEGIDYPLTVEVPLRGGHTLQLRSLHMPADLVQARFYWNEFPRQIENKRGFAFKAWEGWPGNGSVSFPNHQPISYRYELAVAEKPRSTNGLSEQEKSEGFVPLFDGRSLDGWQGSPEHWIPDAGVLTYRPPAAGQNKSRLDLELLSERQYADFILRFEFKLEPGSNNGVAIRTPLEGDPAFVGMEIQVIDTDGWTRGKLKRFQVHGSIYGVVPAKTGHLKPPGEWNAQEILCHGRHVKVTLNGAVIVDANLDEVRPIDGQEHPGLQRRTGHLGFLGHTGSVAFRNIRLKDLSAGAP